MLVVPSSVLPAKEGAKFFDMNEDVAGTLPLNELGEGRPDLVI